MTDPTTDARTGATTGTTTLAAKTRPKVLVVDDNKINTELVRFVLEADGMHIEAVHDAVEAAARLAHWVPDLILMDIQMPGIDGLELTRRLRAEPATRHIAVVAFTAYAMKGDRAKMLEAGCDGYIAKPIDVARFPRQVRDWLRLH